jgi:SAM-dependent methyltransferase
MFELKQIAWMTRAYEIQIFENFSLPRFQPQFSKMDQNTQPGAAGAAVYSPFTLTFYDIWVLGLSNSFAWYCPTKTVQLPFFQVFMGQRHLDIGPGTGYYLANADIPEKTQMTLMDLNAHSLSYAKQRLGRAETQVVQADVTQPLPLTGTYDSISTFFLIHCLPGPLERKMVLFTNLKPHLAENGTIYGTTILGKGVKHNWFGTILMNIYNRRGIFSNWDDGEVEIREALCKEYGKVETSVIGRVLMFSASQPKFS